MKTIVSEKGQITIPKVFRDILGLRPGEEVEFEEHEGTLLMRRLVSQDPISKLAGLVSLTEKKSTDELISEMRGSDWEETLDKKR